ncbi:MAG TPA: metallopeptidase TldD-related protein [Myxococcales bacterium]|nr:metallopeptidase TldD-related protein [Myxococcales bacterium]
MSSLPALLAVLAAAPTPGNDDPVLRALADEVARYRSLQVSGQDAPYYVAGYVNDSDAFAVGASFGALTMRRRQGHREATVQLRLGSPDLDNTNFAGPDFSFAFLMAGSASPVPWEPDYGALRHALWLRFDASYKQAVEALARKKAFLEENVARDRPPDFAPAPVQNVVLPRAALQVDEDAWTATVEAASAIFRDRPAIQSGQATFSAEADNQCFVSSDPVRVRFGDPRTSFWLSATAQAPDGMPLTLTWDAQGRTPGDLPTRARLVHAARDLADRLDALVRAPVLPEDYSGPVLFSGRAAAQFFLAAVGEPLSHPRGPLGQNRGGRLVERLHKHIAPAFLTVRDDPTLRTWRGSALLGYFPVDDDGVLPRPITLIDRGLLSTYYMSRIPTSDVKETNGHSRAGQGSVGNLFVEARAPVARRALEKKLIALAKAADQPYGLLIEDLGQGQPPGRPSMPWGRRFSAGGDIHLAAPVLVTRVYVDGRRDVVRGATFKPISFRTLQDIVALGSDPTLLNTSSFGQPVSVVAPSVLIKQLELGAPDEQFEKPPLLPRPEVSRR